MKDIFIDANIMKIFPNHQDPEFIKFFAWLESQGTLVVSQKLIVEYGRIYSQDITRLLDHLFNEDRFIKKTKNELETIDFAHFKFTCNTDDIVHAKTVCLSNRKIALVGDKYLRSDLKKIPKHQIYSSKRPEELPYI